jgi:hypothetical protein
MDRAFYAFAKRCATGADGVVSRRTFLRVLAVTGSATAFAVVPGARAGAVTCISPKTLCNGKCVNLKKNRRNCGACAHKCSDNEICVHGVCTACAPGTSRCGNKCVDLGNDSSNCGSCGNVCPEPLVCIDGECQLVIPP